MPLILGFHKMYVMAFTILFKILSAHFEKSHTPCNTYLAMENGIKILPNSIFSNIHIVRGRTQKYVGTYYLSMCFGSIVISIESSKKKLYVYANFSLIFVLSMY